MTATYLTGLLAPVPDEIDVTGLTVDGTLPPELDGRYLRNGPNPRPGEDPGHWFTGHGMIHGIRLREGRAEWYRNRWVRTARFAGHPFLTESGPDLTAVPANTHIVEHGGKLLALVENGLPYEMTPDLDTVGPCDFAGRLTSAMTAHPKCDPYSGELHFFGYSPLAPHLTYHRLTAAGDLVTSAEVPGAGPSMMHDFAITQRWAVFLDLPVTFNRNFLGRGMPYAWNDAYPARIGVMPLDRPGDVTWLPIDPCYVFHVGGAHEDAAGRIVLDGCRYTPAAMTEAWAHIGGSTTAAAALGVSTLHRWTIDPHAGTVTETPLDDRRVEFPTLDDRLVGRGSRHRYAVSNRAVVAYDLQAGTAAEHKLPDGARAGEAVFVPGGPGDDEGWLLSIVSSEGGSQLLVLDASDVSGPPVATVTLPRRVPMGFHGSWIAA